MESEKKMKELEGRIVTSLCSTKTAAKCATVPAVQKMLDLAGCELLHANTCTAVVPARAELRPVAENLLSASGMVA